MLGHPRVGRDGLIAAGFIASIVAYLAVPRPAALDAAPGAWRLTVFLLPTTAALTTLLFGRLWRRDPVRERGDALDGVYHAILFRIVAFLIITHGLLLAVLSDVQWIQPWAPRLVVVFLGLTLASIGNMLPRTRPNVVIGIRTAQTLANRDAWIRMHRATGYVTVGIGLVIAVCGLIVPGRNMASVVLAAGAVGLAALVLQHRPLQHIEIDHLWQDVRLGARSLLRYPVACAVAVISLAGGIGATTATLTIRDVVFRRPPPLYRSPGELSRVQVGSPDRPIRGTGSPVPGPLYAIWRTSGVDIAAAAPEQVREVRVGDRRETTRVRRVTRSLFAVLGVDAAIGRTLSNIDAPSPVVLSQRVWQTLFDGRPDVVGATLYVGDTPHTIVGVMPPRFWFSSMDFPIWTPLDDAAARVETGLEVVIRRAHGETHAQLSERLQRGLAEYTSGLPAIERQQHIKVSGLEGTPAGNSMSIALPWLLSSAVLLTLLIACANVAILVIAQWTAREHEIAIRASLGASRRRIVRQLVTESMLLATAGGLLGIATTLALRGLIVRNGGRTTALFDLSLDPRILFEAIAITLLAGLLAGIGPALLETRRLHTNPMRAMASSDRVRQRWRHALVLLEVAVTVALLVVTGGMIDTYRRQYSSDVGYSSHPLVLLRVENDKGVPVGRVRDALTRIEGVASVAPSTSMPFLPGPMRRVKTDRNGARTERVEEATIAPVFFDTLGVPIRAGRAFTSQDSPASRTVILNESLAAKLFPGRDAVGQSIWLDDTRYDVVGVVAAYKNTALDSPERDAKMFLPMAQEAAAQRMSFLIRASGNPAAVERTIRREVPAMAAGNVVSSSITLDAIIDVGGQEILVGTAPLAPLIATGLLLSAAGVYGVLAFAIARRTKELALRIAIGASRRQIVALVASHSVRLVSGGTICGVAATFALSRIVRAAGGGGSFLDPAWTSFVVPAAILIAIGAIATWIPSRRAIAIDPAVLFRTT